MTKGEQVEMQRAAVRTYVTYGWAESCDERVLARLFPMPTQRMQDRTVTLASEKFGPVVVYVSRGAIWASHVKPRCYLPTVMFDSVEALVAAGFVSDPNDVFRVQELFANPREAVEDDV